MDKIKNLFSGVLAGFVFIIIGTMLLWSGEKNNVNNIKTVKEVSDKVVNVSSKKVNSKNDGKLVCTNGKIDLSGNEAKDDTFNISVSTPNLKRVVEMYQWQEESETDEDDKTTYTYKKVWSEDIIDSSEFNQSGHDNPEYMKYESENFVADKVSLGAFELTESQKERLTPSKKLSLEGKTSPVESYTLQNNYFTSSEDIANPNIGDIRVSFVYNNWKEATVLAVQNENSFDSFISKAGKKVNRVEEGKKTANEIIEEMKKENKLKKWFVRIIGIVLIIAGFNALVSFITKLASFVPILGDIVNSVLGLIMSLIGIIYSLVIIIIAWFRYRPLLSLGLAAVIAVLLVAIFMLRKNSSKIKESKSTIETKSEK